MTSHAFRSLVAGLSLCVVLSACIAPRTRETLPADPVQARANDARREALANWNLSGRIAVSTGSRGGSGRIDWQQQAAGYVVELSAPVTRQSWKLTGDSHHEGGRLEGLEGGTREGEDAQQVLLEATGWDIPVNQLPDWVRGLVADAAPVELIERDGEGRPRRVQQMGWEIQYLDWYPAEAGRPVLPRRIEAVNGDAKVRLVVDSWVLAGP